MLSLHRSLLIELRSLHSGMLPKGVTLTVEVGRDVPDVLDLDSLRVHQILSNGLTNAIKVSFIDFTVFCLSCRSVSLLDQFPTHIPVFGVASIYRYSSWDADATNIFQSRVCACAQRTGAAARESLRRDCPSGLTSHAFRACGSASPFAYAVVTETKNQ